MSNSFLRHQQRWIYGRSAYPRQVCLSIGRNCEWIGDDQFGRRTSFKGELSLVVRIATLADTAPVRSLLVSRLMNSSKPRSPRNLHLKSDRSLADFTQNTTKRPSIALVSASLLPFHRVLHLTLAQVESNFNGVFDYRSWSFLLLPTLPSMGPTRT